MRVSNIESLDWQNNNNLLPAVIQEAVSGEVLMLGYMSPQSLEVTLESGFATFYSRKRHSLWTKGETSGHYLRVRSITADCDGDTLLVQVDAQGPVCHLNRPTCFGQESTLMNRLQNVIDERITNGDNQSYIRSLVAQGEKRAAQKTGEEAVEVVVAALAEDQEQLINEAADLLFHLLITLHTKNLTLFHVLGELRSRMK